MRRTVLLAAAIVLLAAGCGGSSSSGARRTVLVDYNHDQFAGIFLAYFPNTVTVHPGDTVHFKQAWNGEPHSVTFGSLVDKALGTVQPLLDVFKSGGEPPPDADQQFETAFKDLPFMTGEEIESVNQAVAQPCFLNSGAPQVEPNKPCPKRTPQPAFNGRQTYFNSGFIPYAGNNGNTFDVKIADDIKPGTYGYYCNFHGPGMQGKVVVKAKSAKIPSQGAVDKQARKEADQAAAPLLNALRGANKGGFEVVKAAKAAGFPMPPQDVLDKVKGDYFSGFGSEEAQEAQINEFLPKTIHAKVGEKVTWLMISFHTISFDVPRYFPLFVVGKDGTVKFDKRAGTPQGGPGFPEKVDPKTIPNPYIVDGGTWDGKGFRNSGITPDTGENSDAQITGFSLTFTKAGRYPFACLIHPRMVGTVIVS
jgi:plastocyanin